MPTIINVHEAKTHLSRLLERVAAGERITIARAGRPIADLVQHQSPGVIIGAYAGDYHYDSDTFDDPDPEIAALFYGTPSKDES